jgi:molecular chaperone DnaK
MNEFKDQLDAGERDKVAKLITELRELAVKGQAGDSSVTAAQIKEAIGNTQQASLGLFQKVYEKRNQENKANETSSESSSTEGEGEKKN